MKKIIMLTAVAMVLAAPAAFAEDSSDKAGHHGGSGHHKGKMFKKADKDGDGAISRDEFNAMHEDRFNRMDANGDGKITEDEAKASRDKIQEKMKEHREKRQDRIEDRRENRGEDSSSE